MVIDFSDEPPERLNNVPGEFYGYRIDFWEKLGFRFRHEKLYDGREIKKGLASFGPCTFNLWISKITIASVSNEETNQYERHAVFEDEAIEWFSRVSDQFATTLNARLKADQV